MTAVASAPTTRAHAHASTAHRLSFIHLMKSESIKMLTLRSTWWSLGVTAALSVGISLLIAAASSDIGGATATRLRDAGHRVLATARDSSVVEPDFTLDATDFDAVDRVVGEAGDLDRHHRSPGREAVAGGRNAARKFRRIPSRPGRSSGVSPNRRANSASSSRSK